MAVLNEAQRKASATVQGDRFPMPDLNHARLALAMVNRAHGLSDADRAKIVKRARTMLGESKK